MNSGWRKWLGREMNAMPTTSPAVEPAESILGKQPGDPFALFVPEDVFSGTFQGEYMAAANCIARDFYHPLYAACCEALRHPFHVHRKLWEWAFIVHHLDMAGKLHHGARGLGFGVGIERLPALFASRGCTVTATDAPLDALLDAAWVDTEQYASQIEQLSFPDILAADLFRDRVQFESADMAHIPDHLTGYDFCWSACCFEHLGSLEAGMDFVIASVEKTLAIGGVACHTTEFNLSSNTHTIEGGGTVIYRRQDIERLAAKLTARGHIVKPLPLTLGQSYIDGLVDVPPYGNRPHLKLKLADYVTTSLGIVVTRGR